MPPGVGIRSAPGLPSLVFRKGSLGISEFPVAAVHVNDFWSHESI